MTTLFIFLSFAIFTILAILQAIDDRAVMVREGVASQYQKVSSKFMGFTLMAVFGLILLVWK
jgi:hypothetical protein